MSRSPTTSRRALAKLKPEVALYVGGMGHRDKNFHKDQMVRRGFGEAADRIQELYLAHRKEEAIAAVPDEWVDMKSLVGPPARIRERFRAWEDSGATGLTVRSRQPEAIEIMAAARAAAELVIKGRQTMRFKDKDRADHRGGQRHRPRNRGDHGAGGRHRGLRR